MRNLTALSFLALPAFVLGLNACSSSGGSKSGGSSLSSAAMKVPPYTTKTLPNGLIVIYVPDNSLPRLGLQATIKTGIHQEPSNKRGVNALTAALLNKGTTSMNASQIAEAFNGLGTEFTATATRTSVAMSADALTTDADRLLELFLDVLTKPSFQEAEVRRARSQTLAALQRRIDNPSGYSRLKANEFIFEGSRHAIDVAGTIDSVRGLTRTDIIKHYFAFYRPNQTLVAVTGRFDKTFQSKLEATLGEWAARDLNPPKTEEFQAPSELQLKLVTKPGLAQTQILLGRTTIARNHPDFVALRLANEALGGSFGSRLMQKLRDDLGLTYGVYSGISGFPEVGLFQISTFTKNESVGKALQETLAVYDQFIKEGVNERELNAAKAQILGQYPRGLETPESVASTLMSLNVVGLPFSEIENYPRQVQRTTLKQVNEALKKNLSEGSLRVLVYGDRAKVASQLAPWKPKVEVAR